VAECALPLRQRGGGLDFYTLALSVTSDREWGVPPFGGVRAGASCQLSRDGVPRAEEQPPFSVRVLFAPVIGAGPPAQSNVLVSSEPASRARDTATLGGPSSQAL
jgi:hypothetical protein